MYSTVREVLKNYGTKGTTFNKLIEETQLSQDELYQTINQGYKCRGIESYSLDGVTHFRNRLRNEQLYGANEQAILRAK